MPPRRFQILFALLFVFGASIVFLTTTSIEVPPAVSAVTDRLPQNLPSIPKIPIPNRINPFAPAAHKPAIQSNSSTGDAKWYSDWRWKNPFSSAVTLDEGRAVLPPLRSRPAIYTFYEPSDKGKTIRAAEETLLLQWRRAWWASGFKPVVLGRAEAINNPLYRKVQLLGLQGSIEVEISRWLAWGNIADHGILSNWLAFPMAAYDNTLLSFLRRGNFPQLTRYQGLESALFVGEKRAINEAIEKVILKPDELKKRTSLADAEFDELFVVDKRHDGVAYYGTDVIKEKYKGITENLFAIDNVRQAKGLRQLGELINAHLQVFQFSIPTHLSLLITWEVNLAKRLQRRRRSPQTTTQAHDSSHRLRHGNCG